MSDRLIVTTRWWWMLIRQLIVHDSWRNDSTCYNRSSSWPKPRTSSELCSLRRPLETSYTSALISSRVVVTCKMYHIVLKYYSTLFSSWFKHRTAINITHYVLAFQNPKPAITFSTPMKTSKASDGCNYGAQKSTKVFSPNASFRPKS